MAKPKNLGKARTFFTFLSLRKQGKMIMNHDTWPAWTRRILIGNQKNNVSVSNRSTWNILFVFYLIIVL